MRGEPVGCPLSSLLHRGGGGAARKRCTARGILSVWRQTHHNHCRRVLVVCLDDSIEFHREHLRGSAEACPELVEELTGSVRGAFAIPPFHTLLPCESREANTRSRGHPHLAPRPSTGSGQAWGPATPAVHRILCNRGLVGCIRGSDGKPLRIALALLCSAC